MDDIVRQKQELEKKYQTEKKAKEDAEQEVRFYL